MLRELDPRAMSFIHTFWITSICVSGGYAASYFTRDVNLDDKKVWDSSSTILISTPLQECASRCHNSSSCLTFGYSKQDRTCELHSRIYVNPEDTFSESGHVTFRKRNDESVCKIATTARYGKVLYIDGQRKGSKAEFACDDFHFHSRVEGVCELSGAWSGLDRACSKDLKSTFYIQATGKIKPGVCVVAIGTPLKNFRFRFQKDNDNYIFITFINFDLERIAGGSKVATKWGSGVTATSKLPFVINQEFNLTVCAEESMFRVYADSQEMFTFRYIEEIPLSENRLVILDGSASLRRVRFVS